MSENGRGVFFPAAAGLTRAASLRARASRLRGGPEVCLPASRATCCTPPAAARGSSCRASLCFQPRAHRAAFIPPFVTRGASRSRKAQPAGLPADRLLLRKPLPPAGLGSQTRSPPRTVAHAAVPSRSPCALFHPPSPPPALDVTASPAPPSGKDGTTRPGEHFYGPYSPLKGHSPGHQMCRNATSSSEHAARV